MFLPFITVSLPVIALHDKLFLFPSSKKDQILSSKEKAATCSVIADALVSAKPTEIQKLLSVGIETLLLLTADADPDVRTNANESLNRVIRVRLGRGLAVGRIKHMSVSIMA